MDGLDSKHRCYLSTDEPDRILPTIIKNSEEVQFRHAILSKALLYEGFGPRILDKIYLCHFMGSTS
jgi:hypothetical protein